MAEDWDLYAIVRSCISGAATNTATSENGSFENPSDCLASLTFEDDGDDDPFTFPHLVNRNSQELQDSYKPFLVSSTSGGGGQGNILGSSAVSDFERFSGQNQPLLVLQPPPHHHKFPTNIATSPTSSNDAQHVLQQQNQRQQQMHQLQGIHTPVAAGTNPPPVLPLRPLQSPSPRSRKKKSHQKRLVLHVTAENLSNDEWAWRKYGQKPIKGSPYPRNYYRCSSSKGCVARKQVERSNTDATLFIVSYTGDHTHPRPTHRNSLAGSTRNKFPVTHKPSKNMESDAPPPAKTSCSSPLSATNLSPRTPLSASIDNEATAIENINTDIMRTESDDDCVGIMDDEDDDGDILIPNNMALNEDLIKGLGVIGSDGGDRNFSSWVVGGSAAAGAITGGDC